MEANRDEAERCIQRTFEALQTSDFTRAEISLRRATHLNPQHENINLLEEAITSEREVNRILRCASFRAILEVRVDARRNAINRSFGRLSLLVHTDRNGPYLALNSVRRRDFNEAMMRLIEAKDHLLRNLQPAANVPDEEEEHEEANHDNNFQPHYEYAPQPRNERRWFENRRGYYVFVFLPVLLLTVGVLVKYTEDSMKEEPIYRFDPNWKYIFRRRTLGGKIRITYFVTKDFKDKLLLYYQNKIGDLERDIKYNFGKKLEKSCYQENDQDSCDKLNIILSEVNSSYGFLKFFRNLF